MGPANKKLIVFAALALTAMASLLLLKLFKTPPPAPTQSSQTEDRPRAILVQGGSIPTFRMPPPKNPKPTPTPCSSKPGSIADPGCKVE